MLLLLLMFYFIQVFTLPIEEQAEEANFYSLMFVVIGVAHGLSSFFQVRIDYCEKDIEVLK